MPFRYLLIGIIAFAIIGGGIFLLSGREDPSVDSPDNEISFGTYTQDTLEQYRGKIVVANSWAVWCPFCVEELKDFAVIQKEFNDQVVVLAINRQESASQMKKFIDELGVTQDLVFLRDPNDSFYKEKLKGFSMPETIFIDREGAIRFHKRGPMDEAEIRQQLQQIL